MGQQQELTKQVGQLASAPMFDPSKNPDASEQLQQVAGLAQGGPPQQ